jgi:archaellum component FlaC
MKDLQKLAELKEKKPEPERKIIKFDSPDMKKEGTSTQESAQKISTEPIKPVTIKTDAPTTKIGDKSPGASADAAREELEQRRNILQSLKDFDFQIKKNQEEITSLIEKVENLSKDLDDLVSLYEIVSEQMNPFVGLSKVTKKRLDALENFTKEVDAVKLRIGDLEGMFEKQGITIPAGIPPSQIKPTAAQEVQTETPPLPKISPVTTHTVPMVIQPGADRIKEDEIEDLLNKSIESLQMEQNLDVMINEFFINLK